VGKTYLATAHNIESATGGRFRPRGLATHAFAIEDDATMPTPLAAPQPGSLPSGRVALLLHEDDLNAEAFAQSLQAGGAQVVVVAAPRAGEPRSTLSPMSSLVGAFTGGALTDGLERASEHFAVEASVLEGLRASEVLPWLQAHDVTTLVTPYAPVGPVRHLLDQLRTDLASEGIALSHVLRPWDSHAWPHASRGFFPFRERIPMLLRDNS
jgi:hypothetical protein